MTIPILTPPKPKLHARSLIVAPRLPERSKFHTGNPFTSEGDMVADCGAEGCGYHVMGTRAHVKLALDEHRKMFHPDEIGVVLLNQPRQ